MCQGWKSKKEAVKDPDKREFLSHQDSVKTRLEDRDEGSRDPTKRYDGDAESCLTAFI